MYTRQEDFTKLMLDTNIPVSSRADLIISADFTWELNRYPVEGNNTTHDFNEEQLDL